MKAIIRILQVLLLTVVTALAVTSGCLVFGSAVLKESAPGVFGYHLLCIESASMQPTLSQGDAVVVKKRSSYETGEVIAFETAQNRLLVHRIVGQLSAGFITRGDANTTEDDELASDIVGEVVLNIRGAGILVRFLQSPIGLAVLILLGIVFLIAPAFMKSRYQGERHTRS